MQYSKDGSEYPLHQHLIFHQSIPLRFFWREVLSADYFIVLPSVLPFGYTYVCTSSEFLLFPKRKLFLRKCFKNAMNQRPLKVPILVKFAETRAQIFCIPVPVIFMLLEMHWLFNESKHAWRCGNFLLVWKDRATKTNGT